MPHVAPLHAEDPRRVGRYRLTGRIVGMPAAGPVYLARSAEGTEVTVTLLGGDWTADSAARDRFTAEAGAARRVAPFCAARLLGAGFDGGQAYLVSEYVAGPSLQESVTEDGAWQDGDLEALAIGTATGLAAIHQAGLVHGEFGPAHVVLGPEGPRVVDFGITPPYGSATPAADMLAWARTMLYAAAGGPAGPDDLDLLPEPLREAAAQCFAPGPGERPAARAVVLDLIGETAPAAGVLGEGMRRAARASVPPEPAADAGPGARSRSGASRGVTIWWAIGITVCVVAIAVAIHAAQNDSARPDAAPVPSASAHATPTASGSRRPASPTPQPTVPATLAGTWSGQVTQSNPPDVFNVQVTLNSGTTGGTVHYSGTSFSCSGDLSLVSSILSTLTMNQGIVQGQKTCADGVVTISQGPSGTVQFSFKGKTGPAAKGTLSKSA
jgi:eukaryotic-like serine/threonine-protein kinase